MKHIPRHISRIGRTGRAGFTLLEVLVALGAVALISIGLARIFGATSDTLRAGRRVSHFNDLARSLERTLRRDVSSMTRDGFLVIGHELTEQPVRVSPDDNNPRRRRIDQMMFFAAGQFQTRRTPLYPTRVASGGQAAVYIGHGLQQLTGSPRIARPPLDDRNRDGGNSDSGQVMDPAPWFGEGGPNRFASDWVLARKVAVLSEPKPKAPPRPNTLLFPTEQQWEDNKIQIDLAPAQASMFRNLARGTPDMLPAAARLARPNDFSVARPMLSSGIVDVVSTSLAEIRSIVLDAQPIDRANRAMEFDPEADNNTDFYVDEFGVRVTVPFAFQPDTTPDGSTSCFAMKQWMLQALPAEPRRQSRAGSVAPPTAYPGESADFGGRIRTELVPPDALGSLSQNGLVHLGDAEYLRADQAMLNSSAFAVACTEFIVEWSFGETYIGGNNPDPFLSGRNDPRADQVIWHGLERFAELDFQPGLDPRADRVAGPYTGRLDPSPIPGVPNETPIDGHLQLVQLTNGGTEAWVTPPRVVHDPVNNQGQAEALNGEPLYSIFGYVDPTYPGPLPAANATTPNDFRQFRPDTIPCPWPRLIRITMTLADPADPSFQQTFQFVFEVPQDRRSGG